MFYRGEVLKTHRRGFIVNCSDGYRVSYSMVRMKYGLRKRNERQVYVGLDRKLCHQPMYWDRAYAAGVHASEGDRGYKDKDGTRWRKHQLGSEAEVVLPRSARRIYVTPRDRDEVSSHLFHPLSFRGCPVFARRSKRVLVGCRGARATPKVQRGVSFVDTDAHAGQREEAIHRR